ncbi:peroxiredoxin family protein [Dyella subtropica]|uniref:peroxiredoxin family protein n=1 Tax=Dyella subtropica TaxID=2992127 RepID=UPI002258DB8D|nr:redoxin domain-containing protein [Dyella subtropica]
MNRAPLPVTPTLHVSRWYNTPKPIALDALRGRVVAIHAFQMLCPGCVTHGLPQAVRLREAFPEDQLTVIGLHTVFEHHAVMGPEALEAFIHEYRLAFPIGVDEADSHSPVPKTMAAWGLRGTPSLVLLDQEGHVQLNHFGRIDDMALGAIVGALVERPFKALAAEPHALEERDEVGCGGDACAV